MAFEGSLLRLQCGCSTVAVSLPNRQQKRQAFARPCSLLTERRFNQGRFHLRSESVRYRREVLVRADTAKTDCNTSEQESVKPLPLEEKNFSSPGRAKWGLPNLLGFAKTWKIQSLAAGVVAAMTTVQVSASILEKVETVPLLPQFEILVGTLFTLNLAAKYLGGGEGRVRLESFFEDVVDRIKGIKGFENEDDEEPSMLDVQLRSLVDQYMQLHETKDASGATFAVPVVPNKAALITALRDFIGKRELKSRRINALLRKDNEELANEKIRARQLEKLLNEQKTIAAGRATDIGRLSGFNAALQTDKRSLSSQVLSLSSRMDAVAVELENMSQERRNLQDMNGQLETLTSESDAKNDKLRKQILSLESAGARAASAVESANARRVEELLIQEQKHKAERERALKEQKAIAEQTEAALRVIETERNKATEAAQKLEERLSEAVSEMEEREIHIGWLQSSLAEAERRAAKTERSMEQLRTELAAVHNQVAAMAQQQENTHAELEATLEAERKRYAESASQLESQLAAVQKEKEEAAVHIAQLEEALAQSELQATATEQSAEDLQTALSGELVVEGASPVELIPATPEKKVAVPDASTGPQGGPEGEEAETESRLEARAVALPKQKSGAKSKASNRVKVEAPKEMEPSPEAAVEKLNSKGLQAFARSARSQYVDVSKTPKEQEAGVDALVKELVIRGATDAWARKYVLDSMAYERRKLKKQDGQGSP